MSLVSSFMTGPTVEAIASALVHFLWQGAVLAMIASMAMRWLTTSAATRYVIGVVSLAAMLSMPFATFVIAPLPAGAGAATSTFNGTTPLASPTILGALADAPIAPPLLPVVTWLWLAGVCALTVRLTGGWIVARRLATRTVRGVSAEVERLAALVGERLGVRRVVHFVESSAVAVPMVVGWLKPVVLIPAAALSGLTSAQIEALLAHELAHIRRHDYLVNLFQSIVETLLFYHPAVWLMSARVREEREHCCDDLAVSVCDRVVYVDALTTLAGMTRPGLALAATDGSLVRRVRRLLDRPADQRPGAAWPAIVVAVALVAIVTFARQPAAAEQGGAAATPAPRPAEAAGANAPVARPAPAELRPGNVATTVVAVAPARQQREPTTARIEESRARLAELTAQVERLARERYELEAKRMHDEFEAQIETKRAEIEAVGEQMKFQQENVKVGAAHPQLVAELRQRQAALERELRTIEATMQFVARKNEIEAEEMTHRIELERAQEAFHQAIAARAEHEAESQARPAAPARPRSPGSPSTRQSLPSPPPPPPPPPAAPDAPRLPPPPPPPPPPPDFARLRAVSDERSVIQPNDVLLASVESRDQPLRVITERGAGSITLPIVGSMRLEGMTVGAARERVREALAAQTDITVRLWVYRDR